MNVDTPSSFSIVFLNNDLLMISSVHIRYSDLLNDTLEKSKFTVYSRYMHKSISPIFFKFYL